jgi:hypothetical protein
MVLGHGRGKARIERSNLHGAALFFVFCGYLKTAQVDHQRHLLVQPVFLILPHPAITALYLTLVLHASVMDLVLQASMTLKDIIGFLAGLNASVPLITTIAQEIISSDIIHRYLSPLLIL